MNDILNRDALAISAALETGEISAVELMEATLAQIDVTNGEVNAVVSMPPRETLLDAARTADETPRNGWLHGIPVAVKDLANVKGLATSWGSPLFKDFIAPEDDLVISRMRDAGAIFIGKTNTPEFGLGSHTFNPVHGATGNPYDTGRSAGGSSGGAAAALAMRQVCVADGSDMMGSLRNPAGWCNVYGHRPTWGLVPNDPVGDVFLHPLATLGPMARSPRDLAALLETQAGPDPRLPLARKEEGPLVPAQGNHLQGARIGWLGDWGGAYPMESGVLDTCRAALKQMEAAGAIVEEVQPPFPAEEIWDSWLGLRAFANAGRLGAFYNDPAKRAGLKADAIWEIETGLALSGADVLRLSAIRSRWYQTAARLFQSYDALVLPTAQTWPFPVEWVSPKEIAGRSMDTYHRWMEVVVPVSLVGLPCTAVPAGFGANGLPMGLQLFGPYGSDAALLRLAQGWHEATDWPNARPPARIA
jgi:amidase